MTRLFWPWSRSACSVISMARLRLEDLLHVLIKKVEDSFVPSLVL